MAWNYRVFGVGIAVTLAACGGRVLDGSSSGERSGTSGSSSSGSSGGSSGSSSSNGGGAPAPIKQHFTAALRMENDLCLPERLPLAADGTTTCEIVIVLPESGNNSLCGTYPGLSPADNLAEVSVRTTSPESQGHPICTLQQIPTKEWVNGTCVGSSWAGWCYVEGAAAGGTCPQALAFSRQGGPPVGAMGWITCP